MKKTWLLIVIAILAVALVGAACTTTEEPAANPDDQTQTDDQTAVDDSWSKVEARGELILGLDDSSHPWASVMKTTRSLALISIWLMLSANISVSLLRQNQLNVHYDHESSTLVRSM